MIASPLFHSIEYANHWLGHGTFYFQLSSGQAILMDPWIDGNPAYPKGFEIQRLDTICISHGHFDHIHDAVPLAQKFSPEVVAIYETCHWLESKGVKNTRPMNKGGAQKVGGLTITMTRAIHSCGILDDGKIIYGGETAGYIQRVRRYSTYRRTLPSRPRVPADRRSLHYEPHEAAMACRLLNAPTVIPMHFGTFPPLTGTPAGLQHRIADTDTKVWALEPGKTVEWQQAYCPTNFATSSTTSGATWPGFRYSASVLFPSPATNR